MNFFSSRFFMCFCDVIDEEKNNKKKKERKRFKKSIKTEKKISYIFVVVKRRKIFIFFVIFILFSTFHPQKKVFMFSSLFSVSSFLWHRQTNNTKKIKWNFLFKMNEIMFYDFDLWLKKNRKFWEFHDILTHQNWQYYMLFQFNYTPKHINIVNLTL